MSFSFNLHFSVREAILVFFLLLEGLSLIFQTLSFALVSNCYIYKLSAARVSYNIEKKRMFTKFHLCDIREAIHNYLYWKGY